MYLKAIHYEQSKYEAILCMLLYMYICQVKTAYRHAYMSYVTTYVHNYNYYIRMYVST